MNWNWSYSPETVKLGVDLCDLDLWPWPFAWTSLLSLVITPENFIMIRWWEHGEKGVTDGQTDWTSHIAAWSQLKTNTSLSHRSLTVMERVSCCCNVFIVLDVQNPHISVIPNLFITRQIWGIWKLRPAYSPERPNLGRNLWCFVPCDLEIWWMTLENNRASLLCCFKLCATFHSHWWIQTGVTVRKRPFGSNSTIFRAVWPWNLTYDLEK